MLVATNIQLDAHIAQRGANVGEANADQVNAGLLSHLRAAERDGGGTIANRISRSRARRQHCTEGQNRKNSRTHESLPGRKNAGRLHYDDRSICSYH